LPGWGCACGPERIETSAAVPGLGQNSRKEPDAKVQTGSPRRRRHPLISTVQRGENIETKGRLERGPFGHLPHAARLLGGIASRTDSNDIAGSEKGGTGEKRERADYLMSPTGRKWIAGGECQKKAREGLEAY